MTSPSALKRALAASAAAVVIGGASIGVAAAQTTTTNGMPPAAQPGRGPGLEVQSSTFISALASRLGITTDQLQQAIDGARSDVGSADGGPVSRPGGPNGDGGGPRLAGGFPLDVAAQAIGISTDQLRQELAGSTLTQVATAHGKNPADVATALKNAASQSIDQLMTQQLPQPPAGRGVAGS